ncbi:MAG: hypothetical protein NT049_01360 [Planctomycetota bacterium]|nr:hypothetical protein [Planctomycetota bacterium]
MRRLCALFNRRYSASAVSAGCPLAFEYAAAREMGDDDAFLIRDEIERLRDVTPKGKARLGDPGYLHRLLLLGEVGRTQVATFCLYQAAIWETKLCQEMARELNSPSAPQTAPAAVASPDHRCGSAKKKRAGRAGDIEALKKELAEHLRAARDHARATLERDKEPGLLPRPQKRELGQRAGVKPHTVTRCFQDSTELQRLWDLAADLAAILKNAK